MGTRDTTWEPLENCNELIHLDEYLTLQNAVDINDLPKREDKALSAALCSQNRKHGKKR